MVRLPDAPDKDAPLSNPSDIPDEGDDTASTGCPLTAGLRAIGGKWSLICLYWLESETRRFNELRRLMPDISHKVLTETLRNLEREGLITRTVHSEAPSHVEYAMSAYGASVKPLIHAIRLWGRAHLSRKIDELPDAANADE
jgi:DNA-binding HxlR family transcriptional regulator